MRRNFSLKRNWSSYISSIKRCNWSFLIITLVALEFVFSFLSIKSNQIIWYVLLTFNSIILFVISWKISLIIITLLSLFFTGFFLYDEKNIIGNSIDSNVYVTKKVNSGIIVKYKNTNVYVKTYDNLSVDDLINLKSTNIDKIDVNRNDFYKYLKSEKVDYIANAATIKYIGTKKTLKRIISDYFIRGPSYYSRYVPLILLGTRNSKNEIVVNKIKNISIIHLFTISGFHINIIILLLNKVLEKLKVKNKYAHLIVFLIILPYIFIMNIPIAATRAFVFSFLCIINKYFWNNKFNKLNLLGITMLLFLITNPYVVYSLSFIFTFILTYAIVFVSQFKNIKNRKWIYLLIIFIFSSIINLISSKEFNFSGFLSSLFFTPIVSFSYILTFIFFWLKPVLDNYYFLIDILINICQYLKIGISLNIHYVLEISVIIFLFLIEIICMDKPKNISLNVDTNYKNIKSINWWLNNY